MTRATKSTPVPVPARLLQPPAVEEADRTPESPALTSTLRLARLAALGLAKGTGGALKGSGVVAKGTGALGAHLGRRGYGLAKGMLSRPKTAAALVDEHPVAAVAKQVRGRRRGRRAVLFVVAGAAVAGGAVYIRNRRTELPAPVAEPPSLRDFETA